MFVSTNRVLVIEAVKNAEGRTERLRIKNGDVFYTAFMSKKMPNLPDSIGAGSQVTISGFIKFKEHPKYGPTWSITATAVIELTTQSPSNASITTEPGEPADEAPKKK